MWDGRHYLCEKCGEVYSDSYDKCPSCGGTCSVMGPVNGIRQKRKKRDNPDPKDEVRLGLYLDGVGEKKGAVINALKKCFDVNEGMAAAMVEGAPNLIWWTNENEAGCFRVKQSRGVLSVLLLAGVDLSFDYTLKEMLCVLTKAGAQVAVRKVNELPTGFKNPKPQTHWFRAVVVGVLFVAAVVAYQMKFGK